MKAVKSLIRIFPRQKIASCYCTHLRLIQRLQLFSSPTNYRLSFYSKRLLNIKGNHASNKKTKMTQILSNNHQKALSTISCDKIVYGLELPYHNISCSQAFTGDSNNSGDTDRKYILALCGALGLILSALTTALHYETKAVSYRGPSDSGQGECKYSKRKSDSPDADLLPSTCTVKVSWGSGGSDTYKKTKFIISGKLIFQNDSIYRYIHAVGIGKVTRYEKSSGVFGIGAHGIAVEFEYTWQDPGKDKGKMGFFYVTDLTITEAKDLETFLKEYKYNSESCYEGDVDIRNIYC